MTAQQKGTDTTAIRSLRVNVPEAGFTKLKRPINATKWPEPETVTVCHNDPLKQPNT